MKHKLLIVLLLIVNFIQAQDVINKDKTVLNFWGEKSKKVFKAPNFKEELGKHKKVAILPFKATLLYRNLPKDFDIEQHKLEEVVLAKNLQFNLYSKFSRSKDDFTVEFQEVKATDSLLTVNGMIGNLENFTPSQIAKALGVDALLYCTYTYTKVASEGGALAVGLLLGSSKVATAELTIGIFNGTDDELLWSFAKTMNQESLSSANYVLDRMLGKIDRNFPYKDQ